MMRAATSDIGRLLGLTGPGAWALAALFIVTYATIVINSGAPATASPFGWVCLALVLLSAILLVLPGPTPLPRPLLGVILGVVVVVTATMCTLLTENGGAGWSSWHFAALNFLLFMVALRGRVVGASIGVLVMVGIAVTWTALAYGDPLRGLMMTYWQVGSFAAGAFFAVWIRRTARKIVEYREAERRQIAAEQERESGADERRRQLERVRSLAGPALLRIASGVTTAEERSEHRLLEAELRDRIRGRKLALDPIPAALRRARSRGIAVALLDDLRDESASYSFLSAAAAWVASAVDDFDPARGDITIRLARGDGVPTVTVAAADGTTLAFTATD